ncbi:segregation/condensation protein A [Candidatus Woesearchaeota archaeon]|nr:segregation/condensation protein A [Candidatus Woesearchaeota archaeon]
MVHDKIFTILFQEDEITWKTLLLELVKSEQMDPWDIDISELTKQYLQMLKEMKEANLRISGKVVLAAAILLRIKSNRLVEEDVLQFDNLLSGQDEAQLYAEDGDQLKPAIDRSRYKQLRLIPKTPQPRKRKVSIYDLIAALEKALEVEKKRKLRIPSIIKLELPEKKVDINEVMGKVYARVLAMFHKDEEKKITFDHLVGKGAEKRDKIFTFIPLLHLTNQRKVDLEQKEAFGEIDIKVIKANIDKEIEKELGEVY